MATAVSPTYNESTTTRPAPVQRSLHSWNHSTLAGSRPKADPSPRPFHPEASILTKSAAAAGSRVRSTTLTSPPKSFARPRRRRAFARRRSPVSGFSHLPVRCTVPRTQDSFVKFGIPRAADSRRRALMTGPYSRIRCTERIPGSSPSSAPRWRPSRRAPVAWSTQAPSISGVLIPETIVGFPRVAIVGRSGIRGRSTPMIGSTARKSGPS